MMDRVSDQPDAAPDAASTTANRVRLLALIAAAVLVADIITKTIAVAQLEGQEPVRILGGLIYLQLLRNPGAAFSMATGFTWILSVIAIGVVVIIVRVARRLRSTGWAVALGLVLGGALGNLVDRSSAPPARAGARRGHVSPSPPTARRSRCSTWPTRPSCCGGVLLVLLALLGHELDGTHHRKSADG